MDPQTALADFLHSKLSQPFQWGVNDCCLFSADWCVVAGKGDPMADFRGKYASAREAIALWRNVGGYAVEGPRRFEEMGFLLVENPRGFSRRGDIALFHSSPHHTAFGIIEGGGIWGLAPSGVNRIPMDKALKVWRVL